MKSLIKFFPAFALLLAACQSSDSLEGKISHGIYCWDQRSDYYYFSKEETKALFDNEVKKVYCKLADVVWHEQYHAMPIDMRTPPFSDTYTQYASIIPCMFFDNEVMLKSTKTELEYMAQKIAARINQYSVKEFQVDCDWSEKSRDNYFHFITQLRKTLHPKITLSATIRLYQYKYPEKAGVPPAERGMLMLYNFNRPEVYKGENAIFDKAEAEKYMGAKTYPLPLDFAISHYLWNVLYTSDNKFIGFIDQTSSNTLISKATYNESGKAYILNEDISIEGYFARKGQKMVAHETNAQTLRESIELIKKIKKGNDYTIAIFDFNQRTLQHLSSDESIFKTMHR